MYSFTVFLFLLLMQVNPSFAITKIRSVTLENQNLSRHAQQSLVIPLTIQEGVGATTLSADGYPVSVVVPFAEGSLFDKDSLTIREGNPCQAEVLERWLSDGSIRHALVHFQARLSANEQQTLNLINTGAAPKPFPSQPVTATETSTYVQVDNGKVRFQVSKTSFNLFDQLWFDQNENKAYETSEQVIVSSKLNGGRFVPRSGAGSTQQDSARTDIQVVIEEAGPVRVVILISAPTLFQSTTDHLHGFAARIYAYAGQPFVKVDYQLQNSAANAVRSWPLYFDEMTVDMQFKFPSSTRQIRIGSTAKTVVNATSASARIQQTRLNSATIKHGSTDVTETTSYGNSAKAAAFIHLSSETTGVTVAMRNFWQTWPNGLSVDNNAKVSVEMFPSWSAQFADKTISSTGLYWLRDMQHVYKEFTLTFHKVVPTGNQLVDLTSTLQFPPVVSVSPSWYRTTRATLDMGGLLPSTLSSPNNVDTFSPDIYWDALSIDETQAFYKGNWVNFGDPEGAYRAAPCTTGGFPHQVEFYSATQYSSHYYLAETWGIGELNVRPQSLPLYRYDRDYSRLRLTEVGYCNGSWRIFDGNGVSKFAAPLLPNTDNVSPTYGARDDAHGWFYHAAESYFYTGNYWMKDWYKFVGQYRRGYLSVQQPFQDEFSRAIAHALGHTHQAIRITGDFELVSEFARYFRAYLLPRQDKLYGSEFNSTHTGLLGNFQTGYLMTSIINFMVLVQKLDVQLHAELFNYLSGLMEWNLNTGNFPQGFNQYVQTGKPTSDPVALTIISPQAWYFWNTGRIEFWNHIESYMTGLLGEKPFGAPWTQYPGSNPFEYGRRNYIFIKQSMRQDLVPPNPILDLNGSFNAGTSITIQWTSPATSIRYHAVWSDKPIVGTYSLDRTVSNWWAANALGISKSARPGTKESMTLDVPYLKKPLYIAMFSFDEHDNMSKISNVAQVGVPLGPMAPLPPIPVPVPTPMAPIFVPIPTGQPKAPVVVPTNASPSSRVINIYQDDSFEIAIENAIPGDTIIVHQGDYFISGRISISVGGTESKPVLIRGAFGEARPRILRASTVAVQNTINIEGATHLTIQGLEIMSNGGDGIKIATGDGTRQNNYITLDDLVIHQVAVGINAQTNVDRLLVRKSHIYDTSNTGEGLYLGCSDGSCIVTNSVIESNWIHDTASSDQGDGIELKKNSFGNVIRNNVIYNTNYPGILVYGAGNGAVNVIEGNVMWNCKEGGIQAAADAIIQNNLVFNSGFGLVSNVHNSVNPRNLKIVHNTFLKNQVCLNIRSWNGQSDIIFANNAVYCDTDTMDIQGGTQNVRISGNVIYPNAAAFPSGSFVVGRGFTQDFEGSNSFNAYPVNDSPLRTAANAVFAASVDFDGTSRLNQSPVDAGAYEWQSVSGRKWIVAAGFKPLSNDVVNPTAAPPQSAPTTKTSPVPPTVTPPQSAPTAKTSPAPLQPSVPPLPPMATFPPVQRPRRRICFSGRNTVQILQYLPSIGTNGTSFVNSETATTLSMLARSTSNDNHRYVKTISLSELMIGDFVRTIDGQFTRVVSFCHKDIHELSTFIQIHRSSSPQLLSSRSSRKICSAVVKKVMTDNHTELAINPSNMGLETETLNSTMNYCRTESFSHTIQSHHIHPALEISPDHLVYVIRMGGENETSNILSSTPSRDSIRSVLDTSPKGWIRAQDVAVGDILIRTAIEGDSTSTIGNDRNCRQKTPLPLIWEEHFQIVTDIQVVERYGVYAPITNTGTLFVSNAFVSSYVAVFGPPALSRDTRTAVTIPLQWLSSPTVQHYLAHTILSPIRYWCYLMPSHCEKETYDVYGRPWYSRNILRFVDWYEHYWLTESIGTPPKETPLEQEFPMASYWSSRWFAFDWIVALLLKWMILIIVLAPFGMLFAIEQFAILFYPNLHISIRSACISSFLMSIPVGYMVYKKVLFGKEQEAQQKN